MVLLGSRGPVPKRSEDRVRANVVEGGVSRAARGGSGFRVPAADREWHPIAKRLWNAAKRSGQSRFYEPSDWLMLFSLCDDLSYYKTRNVRSGQMLQAIMSGLTSLLLTEGDRRRVRIELDDGVGSEGELSLGEAQVIEWSRVFQERRVR